MKQSPLLVSLAISLLGMGLLTSTSHAAFTDAKCQEVLTGNDVIEINRQWDAATRSCFISLTPRLIQNLKYRDYYFDSSGFFMVFNSYGEGPDAENTGSRSFYLFPVTENYPDYSIESNGDVVIKLVSGHLFRVSGKDFSIVSLSDAVIHEKPLSKDNAGGIEFHLQKGFWLDGGFRMGGTRLDSPKNKSSMQSAYSASKCTIGNDLFFDYPTPSNFVLKYAGEFLNQFVKKECPQLKIK